MAQGMAGKGPQVKACRRGQGLRQMSGWGPWHEVGALVWEVGTEAGGAGSWIVGRCRRQVMEF